MKFSPTFLDDIRSRVAISSVVGRKVAWDRRKSNPSRGEWWACCPFHNEKTPSFHVEDRKGRYHCFGCKASGDIFTFLVEKEGQSFPEAVERLAQEAGLPMPKSTAEDTAREAERASLYEILELATKFFESNLASPMGAKALGYLRRRGLTENTIKEFRLGYSLDSRHALRDFLASKGISLEQMISAGLLVAGDDIPVAFDRFRDRVMFPIEDAKGRVIAFGGRALSEDATAKYLNSPETELFEKRRILFNLSRARKPAFEQGKIVVVEGYMDVVAASQEGFTNVVAALGTALTENHLRHLWRLAADPVLCFDGDKAGDQAASRALDRGMPLFVPGYSLRFCMLPPGKDPADLMIEGRQEEFVRHVNEAVPAVEFFWQRETANAVIATPEQKAGLESRIRLAVGGISSEQVRRFYEMSMRIRLSDLFWTHDKTRLEKGKRRRVLPVPPDYETERIILGLAVEFPQIVYTDLERFQGWHFRSSAHAAFQAELVRLLVELEDRTVASIYQSIRPDFYRVLEQVHGRENSGKGLPRGHALYRRFPVARFDPPESFISRYFELLARQLELAGMIEDRKLALERFELTFSSENEAVLLHLIHEIDRAREYIRNEEKELAEEAGRMAEAYYLNRAANGRGARAGAFAA